MDKDCSENFLYIDHIVCYKCRTESKWDCRNFDSYAASKAYESMKKDSIFNDVVAINTYKFLPSFIKKAHVFYKLIFYKSTPFYNKKI